MFLIKVFGSCLEMSFLRLFHLLIFLSMTVRQWEWSQRAEAEEMSLNQDTLAKQNDQQTETELQFSEEGSCPFTSCSYTMSLSVKESKTKIWPLNHIPRVIFNLP